MQDSEWIAIAYMVKTKKQLNVVSNFLTVQWCFYRFIDNNGGSILEKSNRVIFHRHMAQINKCNLFNKKVTKIEYCIIF